MGNKKFSITNRIKSFGYAFHGLWWMLRNEHNFLIHLVAAVTAIVLGFLVNLSRIEWVAICFVIGLVFVLEIINSAIERLADFVSTEKHTSIKIIKDLSAAAVLVGAITALATGLLIFLPKMFCSCSNF